MLFKTKHPRILQQWACCIILLLQTLHSRRASLCETIGHILSCGQCCAEFVNITDFCGCLRLFFFKAYFKENHPHVCLRGAAVLQKRNLEESKLNVTQLKHSKAGEKSGIRGAGQDTPTSVL